MRKRRWRQSTPPTPPHGVRWRDSYHASAATVEAIEKTVTTETALIEAAPLLVGAGVADGAAVVALGLAAADSSLEPALSLEFFSAAKPPATPPFTVPSLSGLIVAGEEPGLVGAFGSTVDDSAGPMTEPADESTRDGAIAAIGPEPSVPAAFESDAVSARAAATSMWEVFMVVVV